MASATIERLEPVKRAPVRLDRRNHAVTAGRAHPVTTGLPGGHENAAGTLTAHDMIDRAAELLEVTYRSADLGNVPDVLSESIFIMLSLNTREQV